MSKRNATMRAKHESAANENVQIQPLLAATVDLVKEELCFFNSLKGELDSFVLLQVRNRCMSILFHAIMKTM